VYSYHDNIIDFSHPFVIALVNRQIEVHNYATKSLVQTISLPSVRLISGDHFICAAGNDEVWHLALVPLNKQVSCKIWMNII
jgi:hypothetical protein